MQLEIVSVYDVKADVYATPVFVQSQLVAQRSFSDIANVKDSPINKHPEDYRLFMLGFFDDETGYVEAYTKPVLICTATEVVKMTPEVSEIFENISKKEE